MNKEEFLETIESFSINGLKLLIEEIENEKEGKRIILRLIRKVNSLMKKVKISKDPEIIENLHIIYKLCEIALFCSSLSASVKIDTDNCEFLDKLRRELLKNLCKKQESEIVDFLKIDYPLLMISSQSELLKYQIERFNWFMDRIIEKEKYIPFIINEYHKQITNNYVLLNSLILYYNSHCTKEDEKIPENSVSMYPPYLFEYEIDRLIEEYRQSLSL